MKSEKMWMAWHKELGFLPETGGTLKSICERNTKANDFGKGCKIIKVTIQPKKRGKG